MERDRAEQGRAVSRIHNGHLGNKKGSTEKFHLLDFYSEDLNETRLIQICCLFPMSKRSCFSIEGLGVFW